MLSHFSAIKAELTLTLQVAGWVFCTFFLLAVHPGPAEMPQPKPLLFETVLWFYVLSLVLLSELVTPNSGSGVSLLFHPCLLSLLSALSLLLFESVSWRMVCPPELSPFSPPLSSTVNKQPVPAPRRGGTVNKKPHLTSPTFQPTLPPLEAWFPAQPEPEPEVPCPAAEAEQPSPSVGWPGRGDGGGGGLNGGVQVAAVKPQVVTQLSAEESR